MGYVTVRRGLMGRFNPTERKVSDENYSQYAPDGGVSADNSTISTNSGVNNFAENPTVETTPDEDLYIEAERKKENPNYIWQNPKELGITPTSSNTLPEVEKVKGVNVPDKVEVAGTEPVSNSEWMGTTFGREYMQNAPTVEVDEEEEARRLRAARTADTIGGLGSLASAFANLYYTGKGANNQIVPMYQPTDTDKYKEQWRKQRQAYSQYKNAGTKEYYTRQRQKLQDDIAKAKYELSARQSEAAILLNNARTEKERQNILLSLQTANDKHEAAMAKIANDEKKLEAQMNRWSVQNANDTRRANTVAAVAASTIARNNAAAANGGSLRSGGTGGTGSKTKAYSGGGNMYDVPTNTDINRMQSEVDAALGVSTTKTVEDRSKGVQIDQNGNSYYPTKTVKKSAEELAAERQKAWGDPQKRAAADAVVKRYKGSPVSSNVSQKTEEKPKEEENPKAEPSGTVNKPSGTVGNAGGNASGAANGENKGKVNKGDYSNGNDKTSAPWVKKKNNKK